MKKIFFINTFKINHNMIIIRINHKVCFIKEKSCIYSYFVTSILYFKAIYLITNSFCI
uniref:Uncharacterized protein n=1 Tax=Strongyloides stercoralis TaxID=6248 RepID=A0A0K0DV90_STRER